MSARRPSNSLSVNYCSSAFNLCFVMVLGALSGCFHPGPEIDQYQQGLVFSRDLIERCGETQDPRLLDYVENLQQRLSTALLKKRRRAEPFEFQLVLCDEPMAYAPGGGIVIFSRGLVRMTRTESELAFVLSHELAHDHLGHLATLQAGDDVGDRAELERSLELEADRYAVGVMAIAGYDPRSSVQSLQRAYHAKFYEVGTVTYPSLAERLRAVEQTIAQSAWLPPGTIDRRDFQTFRLELLSAR